MLPPTDARASVSLGEKPAPQSWREKMLGTRVCFTRESKKGSRLSSGWWEEKSRGRTGMGQCHPFARGSPCPGELPSLGPLHPQGSWLRVLLEQGSRSPAELQAGPQGIKQSQGKRQLNPAGPWHPRLPAGLSRARAWPAVSQDSPGRSQHMPAPGSLPSWSH